jgi:hypothetical protein
MPRNSRRGSRTLLSASRSWGEILLAESAVDFAPDVIGFGIVTVMSDCSQHWRHALLLHFDSV